jgi:hypothetical protein
VLGEGRRWEHSEGRRWRTGRTSPGASIVKVEDGGRRQEHSEGRSTGKVEDGARRREHSEGRKWRAGRMSSGA